MAYSKLYSSIVHSSLWTEPDNVRLLFITLLAIADREGYVYGSRGGLERLANIENHRDTEQVDPWEALMSPDTDSSDRLRNPENEGRRIEESAGGFKILNYLYYRGLRNEDDRREQNREAQRKHRAKVSPSNPTSASVSQDKQSPSASASACKEEKSTEKRRAVSDSEWLQSLVEDKTYEGIDVTREHGKMIRWCSMNGKEPTRRRFVNWLNRADKRLSSPASANIERHYEPPPREISDEEREKNRQIAATEVAKLKKQFRHE